MKFRKQYPELKTCIVNLKSGSVFRGVVFDIRGKWMILRNSEILRESKNPQSIDGEIVFLIEEIAFLQVIQ